MIKKTAIFLLILLILLFFYPILRFRRAINPIKRPVEGYKKGVYHFHSEYSHDSNGKIEEIIDAARKNNLDFLILTDHGRPNLKSSMATKKYGKILLIGASEFSLDSGHMTAIGYKNHPYKFAPEPQEAIDEINSDGGIEFIAHPFDTKIPWKNWDIRNFTGIEVLNSYSCIRRCNLIEKILAGLYYYISPTFSLLYVTEKFNHRNFRKWDNLNKSGKYYGIFGLDAHGNFMLSKNFSVKFPEYRDMFGLFNIYVKIKNYKSNPLDEKEKIIEALREGHFFNVIEAIGSANGFENFFITEDSTRLEMGDSSKKMGTLIFKLPPIDGKIKIVVFRDGKIFKTIKTDKKLVKLNIVKSGIYRSEIFLLKSYFKDLLWIVTNPFFIEVKNKKNIKTPIQEKERELSAKERYFHTRKEGESKYKFKMENSICVIRFKLNGKGDRFGVGLYFKNKRNLSQFRGIFFETKSRKKMRYFIVFRYKNACFRHTFLSREKWRKIIIPFSSLISCDGSKSKFQPDKVKYIHFTINNFIAYKNQENTLYIKNVRFYK